MREKKGDWWQVLGRLHQQTKQAGDDYLVAFVDLLCCRMDGTNLGDLTSQVPPDYQELWRQIIQGIRSK